MVQGVRKNVNARARTLVCASFFLVTLPVRAQWNGYAGDPQHTAISSVSSLPLTGIRWSTPVDEGDPGNPIYIHYGSPLITAANTVVVPVRTSSGAYRIEARSATTGTTLWQRSTDFASAPSQGGWVPSFSPTLTPSGALYYQGAGGTVYRVDNPNGGAVSPVAINFLPDYAANAAAYNSSVFISTPLTSDSAGNIYFGYETKASAPGGLPSGIARIGADGSTKFMSANAASGVVGATDLRLGTNCAAALSLNGSTLYVGLNGSSDYIAAVNATTLAPLNHRQLTDGEILDVATSSPTVGPDGQVYFGTWRSDNHYRGLLDHFSADLSVAFAPGSFGWDITPSIIPASMVPSYHGTSSYLVMVKYNNYKGPGDGVNKLAILDPNATQPDAFIPGLTVMADVLTIAGVTPDSPSAQYPNAVREWCINTAAVDPSTKSILVNSEDGKLYRWDLRTNQFTESVELVAGGILEAYTPTAIGPDGAVYAINKARLFSVVPEPGSAALLAVGCLCLAGMRRRFSSR